MKIILEITKGKPTSEQLHNIISQICEGYRVGYDSPNGINWQLSWEGKSAYEYLQSLPE